MNTTLFSCLPNSRRERRPGGGRGCLPNSRRERRPGGGRGPALLLWGALLVAGCTRDTPGYCTKDDDCPQSQRCQLPAMACMDGARGCLSNSDCAADQLCNGGACLNASLRGILSAAQAQPPTCTVSSGTVMVVLDGSDALISLTHDVKDPGDAFLTAPGGSVMAKLTSNGAPTRVTLAADQLAALNGGGYSVTVPSASLPAGEIAGPLRAINAPDNPLDMLALLSGSQESPPSGSTATGNARITVDEVGITFKVTTTIKGVTMAHIHRGLFNSAGAVGLDLAFYGPPTVVAAGTTLSGQVPRAEIPAGLLDQLRAGRTYVNVHTAAFPGGEISGELLPYNGAAMPRPIARPFQVVLTGRQVPQPPNPIDPNLQGLGQFVLSQDNKALTFRVNHNVSGGAAAAHLHRAVRAGAQASADPVVCTLSDGSDGAQGTCPVNTAVGATSDVGLNELTAGLIYVDVHPSPGASATLGGFLAVPALQ